jgi:hypothetical protein
MTHQLRCGSAPPTLRGPWSSVRGAANWQAVPVGPRPVPHRGCRTPMYRPELCARSRFQPHGTAHGTSPLYHPLRYLGGLGPCGPAIGYPMTPHVCSWAAALGLWGVGNQVPSFPDHQRWGKMIWKEDGRGIHTIPYPTFGTDSQSISALTCPGRPTIIPRVPPGYVWIGIEWQPLSRHAPR